MGYQLASFTLTPVLALQGRRVRRTARPLPEPPGPRNGIEGDGAPLRLLILGDSAAAGVGAGTQEQALSGRLVADLAASFRVEWTVVARTGATTAGTVRHLARRATQEFDVAVLSLGSNDVTSRRTIRAWLAEMDALVAMLRERFGVRQVLVSGLPPMDRFFAFPQPLRWYLGATARRFDRALALWVASREGCEHVLLDVPVDKAALAPDGLHPGPSLYAIWSDELARRIRTRWP